MKQFTLEFWKDEELISKPQNCLGAMRTVRKFMPRTLRKIDGF